MVVKRETLSYELHRGLESLSGRYGSASSSASPLAPEDDSGSVNAWRHDRMRSVAATLIASNPEASWLTVGDGRYGADARYLLEHGAAEVLATSLTDHSLEVAANAGVIGAFAAANMEDLQFDDASFDFVLCKESYHHLPRPPIGFYEMLRVARRAVVLIEPVESGRRARPLGWMKRAAKTVLRRGQGGTDEFEVDGNYLYRTSVRDIEKMMTAMNYRRFDYRYFNDFWHPASGRSAANGLSTGFLLTRAGIAVQDLLCSLRLLDPGLATFIVWKDEPSAETVALTDRLGLKTIDLPRNPYIDLSNSAVTDGPG